MKLFDNIYGVLKWPLFWIGIYFLTILFTPFGIPIQEICLSVLLTAFYLQIVHDKSGIQNVSLVSSTYYLSAVIQRYQYANNVGSPTNFVRGAAYPLVLILVVFEFWRTFIVGPEKLRNHKIVIAAILFLTVASAQLILGGQAFDVSRRTYQSLTFNYLMFVLSYFVAIRNNKIEFIRRMIILLTACAVIENAYGIYQFFYGIPVFEVYTTVANNIEAVVFSPDFVKILGLDGYSYGMFYNLPFYVILLFLLGMAGDSKWKMLLIFNGILSVILLLTFTERTALVMFAITSVSTVLLTKSNGKISRLVLYSILLFAVGIFILLPIILMLLNQFASYQGLKFERMTELANPMDAATMIWRLSVWEEGVNQLRNGFWLGDGFRGGYGFHMEYLNILVSLGIFGFLSWVLVIAGIFKSLWHLLSKQQNFLITRLSILLISFGCSMLFAAIPDNPFTYTCGFVFFLLSGILLPLERISSGENAGLSGLRASQ